MVTDEDFVYGHVMLAISGGLYPNKLDILREYLQNSYDEINKFINSAASEKEKLKRLSESKIEIKIDSDTLYIFDNGPGMDIQTLNEYRKIGFSKKTKGDYAGWRGIGKAAGFAVAEKIIVNTSTGNGIGHQLIYNAKELRDDIINAKKEDINIPLDSLIPNHSDIKPVEAKKGSSYTMIELHNIAEESPELLDEDEVIAHLSLIAPLPFNPDFNYADEIEENLKFHIKDYNPMNLFVNGEKIYKPYMHEWTDGKKSTNVKSPVIKTVYDNDNNLIAVCWYCMHNFTGQIKTKMIISNIETLVRGLYFRMHNIRIGDENLTRQYLWLKKAPRSFHAFGEIHILDQRIEPTSGRNDFVDNYARSFLFHKSLIISKEINDKAEDHSIKTISKVVIEKKETEIIEISKKIEKKRIPKDIVLEYLHKAQDIKEEVEKRKKATPERKVKAKADLVILEADKAIKKLSASLKVDVKEEDKVYKEITDELRLSGESLEVFEILINVLKNYYANDPLAFEEIYNRIEKALVDAFSS